MQFVFGLKTKHKKEELLDFQRGLRFHFIAESEEVDNVTCTSTI